MSEAENGFLSPVVPFHFRDGAIRFLKRTSLMVIHPMRTEDIGEPEHFEVRDGVVLETDMRTLAEGHSDFLKESTEEQIANLKKDVEWQKMKPISWHGLKYFIISKKLPQPEVRRYLRQELERLKSGCDAFFREAGKMGLERDDDWKFADRLKVADGKPTPSDGEIQKLFGSVETFGITELEFSWGKKLCGVLEKLLGD